MPLIQGKGKKAFKKNIETEMHAGKPQKQSLAIAYSVKRKNERKKMAEGGDVDESNHGQAGINKQHADRRAGTSEAGHYAKYVTSSMAKGRDDGSKEWLNGKAKEKHKQTISEMRSMPNPKLKGLAEGGSVKNESAITESRPMPNEHEKDQHEVELNSHKNELKDSKWTDQPEMRQSRKGLRTTPIKHPRMAASDIIQAKLRDDEDHLMDAPMMNIHEKDEKKSGNEVPDMEDEHSTKRKAYAKGGEVESEDYRHPMHEQEDDLQDLDPSIDEGRAMAHSEDEMEADRQGPAIPDMEESHAEHSTDMHNAEENEDDDMDINPARLAEGGMAHDMDEQPEDEESLEHHASVAAAIMAQREAKRAMDLHSGSEDMDEAARYAEGGEILSHDSIDSDDSDMADLSRNADEDANEEDQLSWNALRKENYSESDMLDPDQPMDSNEHSDSEEMDSEDDHDRDVVSQIRRNMKRRSPIAR